MITLVLGSSNSGKSRFAEDYVCSLNQKKRYYLATMEVLEEEGKKRVDRHRKQREGKGFFTIEKGRHLLELEKEYDFAKSNILLECVSNLVANEMFAKDGIKERDKLAEALYQDIEKLSKKTDNLVVVSTNYFAQSDTFDEETKRYVCTIYELNAKLEELADEVYEVQDGVARKRKERGTDPCMS